MVNSVVNDCCKYIDSHNNIKMSNKRKERRKDGKEINNNKKKLLYNIIRKHDRFHTYIVQNFATIIPFWVFFCSGHLICTKTERECNVTLMIKLRLLFYMFFVVSIFNYWHVYRRQVTTSSYSYFYNLSQNKSFSLIILLRGHL